MSRTPRRHCHFSRPFTRTQLLAAGFTVAELRGWIARREVTTMAHGLYCASDIADEPAVRAVYGSAAVADGRVPVPVLGAAVLHGLWVPPAPHAALSQADARHAVPPDALEHTNGLLLPDAAWTALQLARWQTLAGALPSLDSALRMGVSLARLRAFSAHMAGWPGAGQLEAALAAADKRSESALESWSRGLMLGAGIPAPEVQRTVWVGGTRMRADFAWPDRRVIGEADGLTKYGDGEHARNAIHDEKRRQARLQSAGYVLYRWGWSEVFPRHDAWLRGLRAALHR